jgi:hypothetical protein
LAVDRHLLDAQAVGGRLPHQPEHEPGHPDAAADRLADGRGRAKRDLGWQPGCPSWRQGFRAGLG